MAAVMNQRIIARSNGSRLGNSGGVRSKIELLKMKPGVTEALVESATRNNGRDEVVFRSSAGDLYVVQSEVLAQGFLGLGFPTPGAEIEVGTLQGSVLSADQERSPKRIGLPAAMFGMLAVVGAGPATIMAALAAGLSWAPASTVATVLGVGGLGAIVAGAGFSADRRLRQQQADGDARLGPLVESRTQLAPY